MSKRNKKRTKRYSGDDAKHLQVPAAEAPIVHHYSAVDRSRAGQWWFERKKVIRIIAIAAAIILVVIFVIVELIQIIF